MTNKPHFSQILQFTIQSGESKAFVATFVATQRMWLDTIALCCKIREVSMYLMVQKIIDEIDPS
jgi:hypothetical protein